MFKMSIALLALFLALGGPLGCQGDDQDANDEKKEDPRKPSWWPDKDKSEFDLDWPPPKPAGWPDDKEWPPLKEVGEDPSFWTELYGEIIDAEEDERLKESGEMGNKKFKYNFEIISTIDLEKKPGCGMHVFAMFSQTSRQTCTPYPEAEVRTHCEEVFDQNKALRTCQSNCARNERQCRAGRLIPPPFEAYWRCATFPCRDVTGNEVVCRDPAHEHAVSDCVARYLCDCFEN